MRGTSLSLVFLFFVCGTKDVCSSTPGSGNPHLAGWPAINSKAQSPSGSISNPCDATTLHSGASDAHLECQNQCVALKAEIRSIYNMFSYYMTAQYLHEKCGLVTEGNCSTATSSPVCWCYTRTDPNDYLRNTLSNCRGAIHIMREFTTAITGMSSKDTAKTIDTLKMEAVHMQNLPPTRTPTGHRSQRQRRLNTKLISACCGMGNRSDSPDETAPILQSGQPAGPSVPPSKKQKAIAISPSSSSSSSSSSSQSSGGTYLPDGHCLYTTVLVSGRYLLALVDTGAEISIIHPNFAGNYAPDKSEFHSLGAEHRFQVLGISTIQLGIAPGVTVPLTGYVVDRNRNIVLGNDFLMAWAAKIRISAEEMELFTGLSPVVMNIRYILTPAHIGMMNLYPEGYTSLKISAVLNGRKTRIILDTGASASLVDSECIQRRVHPSIALGSFGGSDAAGFTGTTKVNLEIESYSVTVPAFVPNFRPDVLFLAGNDFIRQYVQLIDYETKYVTLNLPGPSGPTVVRTKAFVISGE